MCSANWTRDEDELISNLANVKGMELEQIAKNYFPDKHPDDVKYKYERVRCAEKPGKDKVALNETYRLLKNKDKHDKKVKKEKKHRRSTKKSVDELINDFSDEYE